MQHGPPIVGTKRLVGLRLTHPTFYTIGNAFIHDNSVVDNKWAIGDNSI
jgi:hypothetical protein